METGQAGFKVSLSGEVERIHLERLERLATPLEVKLLMLTPQERLELLNDAIEKHEDLEILIETIHRIEQDDLDFAT